MDLVRPRNEPSFIIHHLLPLKLQVNMGGSRGGGDRGSETPWKIMLLYFSLDVLVQTYLEKQLDPLVQLLLEVGPYGPL